MRYMDLEVHTHKMLVDIDIIMRVFMKNIHIKCLQIR